MVAEKVEATTIGVIGVDDVNLISTSVRRDSRRIGKGKNLDGIQ